MTRPLLVFFALTYLATWLSWAAAAGIVGDGTSPAPLRDALGAAIFMLGVFAPALVALALTHRTEGRKATRALLRQVVAWRVDLRWYLFAIAFFPTIELSVAVVHRLAAGTWPRFGPEAWYVMAGAIVVSTWVQAGEEIGWRGYALPRLSATLGLAPASVLLGIIWATWHLPLFFALASDSYGQSFPLYLLQVTALSVAAAWLYWRTGGSLLLVMLLHAAINNTKDIVQSAVPGASAPFGLSTSLAAWLTAALLWVAAAYFAVRMRGVRTVVAPEAMPPLPRTHPVT